MRDIKRLEPIYDYLRKVHEENFPDWRFFQFMVNFFKWYGCDPFYVEDDKVIEKIDKFVLSIKTHDKFVKGI